MTKRIFDFLASLIGLILLSPILLVTALLIKLDSPGGVFFRGERIGRYGKPFRIFKFRSMVEGADKIGKMSVGDTDNRITKIGHFLRNSKLDEFPQLLNVLRGEMSLVGPRPDLRYYIDMFTEEEKPILDLLPGVTDWASIVNSQQYKNFTQVDDPDKYYLEEVRPLKIRLQLYYRYHHGFFSDIGCIFLTLYKVITHSEWLPEEVQTIVDTYRREKTLREAS